MSSSSPSSSSPRKLKIGIIGFGPFAQFLAQTMSKQGHSLRATSRSDHTGICAGSGVSFFRDMDLFLDSDNDVILFCTSILSLSEVVESIPFRRLKQPTLFADVLSVKEHPRDVLLKVVPEDSNLLCTHPMFGPRSGKDGWRGLSFVYDKVRIRDESTCATFLHIFASEGCKMLEMSCEDHDKLAAKTQFVTHTVGRILSEMEIEPTSIDTEGFQKLVEVMESTKSDSFDLYSGLFIHNRFAKEQLTSLELALEKVKEKLQEKMSTTSNP